jgi:VanZ family protein
MRLLPWLVLLVAVALFPFDLQFAAVPDVVLADSPWPDDVPVPSDVLLNVLLFVPFGVWLQVRQKRWSGAQALWRAVAAGLLVSSIIEMLQAMSPRRDVSVVDLLANGAGTWVGAWVWRDRGASLRTYLLLIRSRISPVTLAGVMLMLSLAAALVSGILQRGSRLTTWSRDYPLVVGNERTGDRPWRGRVIALTLSDVSLPATALETFAPSGRVALPGRPVAVYVFEDAAPYVDRSRTLPPLRWTAGQSQPADRAVFAPERPWLQTEGPADGLVTSMRASNAFTLRLICASDDPQQIGPARILSNSIDSGHRNFTIAQDGSDLVVRLRTPHTGLNGVRPEIRLPEVFDDRGRRDIVVTYDGSSLRVAVGQSHRVHRTDFTPGSVLAAAITSLPLEAADLPMLQVVFVAAVFFAPGAVYGLFSTEGSVWRRTAWGIAWVLLSVALVESARTVGSGAPIDRIDAVRTLLVGGAAFAVGTSAFCGLLRCGEASPGIALMAGVRPT